MDLKQIDWLQQASGKAIAVPLSKMPEPEAPAGTTMTPQEIDTAKTQARDAAAKRTAITTLLADEQRRTEERKQFLLANAQRVIDPLKPSLQNAFDIGFQAKQQTSTMKIKHKKTVQRDFIAKDGDTSRSGDVRDMQDAKLTKDGAVLDQKAAEQATADVNKAYGVLRGLRDELVAETIVQMIPKKDLSGLEPGPKLKLFTRDEIIEELFAPLERSKILPDALIENAYSKTQAMLDATNELYKADLTDPAKFTGRGVATVTKGLVDAASGACACVLQATGVIDANSIKASAILTGTTELLKLAIDTGDQIETAARRTKTFDRKALVALLDQLPDIAGQIAGMATNDSKLQKIVASSVTAGEQLVTAVIAHNYDDSSKMVGQFCGNMVQAIINGYATTSLNDSEKARNALIADTLGKGLTTAMAGGAPVVARMIVNGEFAKARGQFARICLDAVQQLPNLVADIDVQKTGAHKDAVSGEISGWSAGLGSDDATKTNDKTGETEQVHNKSTEFTGDQMAQYMANTAMQTNEANAAKTDAKTLQGAIDAMAKKSPAAKQTQPLTPEQLVAKKRLDALAETFKHEEEAGVRDELAAQAEKQLADFKAQMRGESNPSLKQHTVDALIADLKRNQAIMATLIAIGTGGAAIAGKFVSYAAVGTEAIQLAANAKLAYEKMRAAYTFNNELKGARETANAYATSIDNFLKNAKFQLTAASINAAMNGVKLIVAAVASAVPHAAPAVPAAAALSSGVNAVMGGIKQAKLKQSWEATKKALKDPANRRLGMKARRMNPTLAKYTIAYGMMEEDPIAISMGLACGLTEKALKNPSTNVAKVKQYLEAKFPDDGTVGGFWEDEPGWESELPDPKLNTTTLAKLYKVVGAKFPAVGPVPPGPLAGLMAMVSKPPPKSAPPEEWLERSELLKELSTQFEVAGKSAAETATSNGIVAVFGEFADLASEEALAAYIASVPPPP